jgi:two-component system cell cycle sensor histidine kinase/response regulator CckA
MTPLSGREASMAELSPPPAYLSDRYLRALRDFTAGPSEEARQEAYDVGRFALEQGLGVVELAHQHARAMDILLAETAEPVRLQRLAALFFVEAAASLEMELRGYQEANRSLQALNRDLELRVRQRTSSLGQAEARLRLHAERQAALAGLSRQAVSRLDLPGLFNETAELLKKALTSDYSRVMQLDHAKATVRMAAGAGWEPGVVGSSAADAGPGTQDGYTLQREAPVLVEDLTVEDRFQPQAVLLEHGVRSGAAVTILGAQGPWGVLAVDHRQPRGYSEDEVSFLRSLADMLTACIQRQAAEKALGHNQDLLHRSQRLESLGQLAGGVAHDFNNLLTVIAGYVELGLMDLEQPSPSPGSLKASLEEIRKAGRRAADLTRQLLAFGRKQVIDPRPLDLNAVLAEMEKMLRRVLGEDVSLQTNAGAELWPVKADAGQMEQVVMNLAINARDAMPEGGKLTLSLQNMDLDQATLSRYAPEAAPGPYVMLSVSDTGTGMDAETRSHIFEPFFTTKELGRGTGLGLATVYGIVQQNKGFILVYSEPGLGSTFKVWLPALTDGSRPSLPEAPPLLKPGTATETLLLVEDDEMVRGLAQDVLRLGGYKLLVAAGPEEALRLSAAHSGPLPLLVTDVVMPGMNGRVLAQRLVTERPDLKVLFLSGFPNNAILYPGQLDSRQSYLEKPYTPAELLARIRQLLDKP